MPSHFKVFSTKTEVTNYPWVRSYVFTIQPTYHLKDLPLSTHFPQPSPSDQPHSLTSLASTPTSSILPQVGSHIEDSPETDNIQRESQDPFLVNQKSISKLENDLKRIKLRLRKTQTHKNG